MNKYLKYFLIASIFFGVLLRFYDLGSGFIYPEEPINMIAAIKLNHDNSYDPRLYGFEHPPLGKWLTGLPTRFIDADYSASLAVPPQMFVWNYKVPFKEIYVPMRAMSALSGTLTLLFVFLITKELFGIDSALWSTALASLSFDLITLDRTTFPDTYMHLFTLATVYFYIRYVKSATEKKKRIKNEEEKKKRRFLILTFIFFTLNLGTRNLQPLFMVPVLAISQLLLKGKKEMVPFATGLAMSLYTFWYILYPPSVRELMRTAHHQVGSYLALAPIEFSFPTILKLFFLRNSYLFAMTVLLLIYELFLIKNNKNKLSPYNEKNPILVILLLFLISFLFFGITAQGKGAKYLIFLYLPMFILGGKALEKAIGNKIVLALLTVLILINVYLLISYFPNFDDYANFGSDQNNHVGGTTYPFRLAQEDAIKYLNSIGNPPIITNIPNLLVFYPGEKEQLIVPYESNCNQQYIENLRKIGTYVVYWPSPIPDIKQDVYVCPYISQTSLALIRSFEAGFSVIIYRL